MATTANILNNNKRAIALVAFLFLSSVKMFGQSVESTVPVVSDNNIAVASATQSNSQMELVMWIMGSSTQIKSDVTNTISTNGTEKKKYINNGMTPNRILSKTILKKAATRDNLTA